MSAKCGFRSTDYLLGSGKKSILSNRGYLLITFQRRSVILQSSHCSIWMIHSLSSPIISTFCYHQPLTANVDIIKLKYGSVPQKLHEIEKNGYVIGIMTNQAGIAIGKVTEGEIKVYKSIPVVCRGK